MKVLITGATGLIGQELVKLCLKKNIAVHYLTTSKSKLEVSENYKGFYWNPEKEAIDKACFNGVDAIIHLAGATISKRWTTSYKKVILSSRRDSTRLLVNSLKGETHHIKQVISASAIGIYPDSLINYYDESFKITKTSFLSEVAKVWEDEVDAFSKLDILVSKIRIGLVLSNKGGALQEMVKPVKFGVGAAFGSGKQWQSWIHLDDLSQMFMHVLTHQLPGVYNGVALNPVTNNELVKVIASVTHKPLFLPNIPQFVMKLILGDMHVLLFESQRVSSKKIEDTGFYFQYHHLQPALEDLL
ncbi:TIGR01777 family oxidoreductase [Siansivirga zeaxanthinifaciens]|uniref:NAD-dependent epimerase n=1 Tax=Siansivirga zeaxanthinifaciens CC-SAMT-1 TaxID=1454006 RepID=A0A0C5WEJ9_9FLAO|nr:TIGR01777 family oxidoreductase [Siansivirga zeaxanthinifaciens]AJR04647.1 NAD-dependent epimerase [Siansivirga zeaxanthinifaciens CC-SAMT-1]